MSSTIAYLFTTFPKSTETFLQREVAALRERGVRLRLYSLWGGGGTFQGQPVNRFPKILLLTLLWRIPLESWRRPDVLRELLRGLFTRRPPSWLNFWENLLGAGFAAVFAGAFRRDPPDHVHAVWGGAPATAAWLLYRLNGQPYSAAAHAYDLYEHGGDWWLVEKLRPAAFVHTSTEMGRQTLLERGLPPEQVCCIRRGLTALPPFKALRPARSPLRLAAIARLVPKKGLDHQLRIYAALREAGVPFAARIAGEGPQRRELERLAAELRISEQVEFAGHLPGPEIGQLLDWADGLLHTGVVAPSGDRDGLPNVIPEAMAAGAVVITSPAAATTEAIRDGVTGLVRPVDRSEQWVEALRQLSTDDALAESLRKEARRWVEENFRAEVNTGRLLERFQQALSAAKAEPS